MDIETSLKDAFYEKDEKTLVNLAILIKYLFKEKNIESWDKLLCEIRNQIDDINPIKFLATQGADIDFFYKHLLNFGNPKINYDLRKQIRQLSEI